MMPPRAGIVYAHNEGGVASCMREKRAETPAAISKWRRSGTSLPGQRVLHPGQIGDVAEVDPKMSFGSGGVKASDHVADIWRQPGADTDVNRLKLKLTETVYRSTKREPLGKGYQRGHQLPQKVQEEVFMFGVSSDKSEAAKALLYPHPSDADMKESGVRCGPGEQRRRGYKYWEVDIENHRFGRPGSLASPLCLDDGGEPPSRLVTKKLDDFRETQDKIGRARNLGHDSRDHLEKHIYGREAVKRGPNEWDARACVEGDYSWAEQQPDDDLGKSITPGFRNAIGEGRAFGVPSIRSDIQPYAQRSVADTQNYGDSVSARQAYLVNPSQFSQFGIQDDEFFTKRGERELRELFQAIGHAFSPEVFESIWKAAVKKGNPGHASGESCSIIDVQRALNDFLQADKAGPSSVK
ncbi:unnamed protein product [Hapterophycus canaliculatus]